VLVLAALVGGLILGVRDIVSPVGDPGPVWADRYACPTGDYVWYRPDVGTLVPDCPTHHIPLTRN
jgi:hypothetical protein